MKRVSLKFETILRLFEFVDLTAITGYKVDRISNVIVAELTNADIELAERCYRAKVVRMQLA